MEQYTKINEGQCKALTGGGMTVVRDLCEKAKKCSFRTTARVMGLCNNLPSFDAVSYIIKRIIIFPFEAKSLSEDQAVTE